MRALLSFLVVGSLLLGPVATAQTTSDAGTSDAGTTTDGGTTDAGTPPADGGTQGEGGSDRDGTEGDDSAGRVIELCRQTSDCSQGFSCYAGKCTWSGFRQATREGCLATLTAQTLALFGFGALLIRTRRRSR